MNNKIKRCNFKLTLFEGKYLIPNHAWVIFVVDVSVCKKTLAVCENGHL